MKISPRWASNPWLFFLPFTLVNACLSYAPLSLTNKFWIFFLCFVPLFVAAFYKRARWLPSSYPLISETLPNIRLWVWLLLGALALYLRFFRLETLSTWPIVDEGRTSLFAIEQAQHWDWKLLYGYNQLPPFYYWLFAFFYKVFQPSLFSLWFFPALLSTMILFLGYGACRSYFSSSFTFLAVGLLAFSFWPLYAGRFAVEGLGVLLWEMVALWVLGLFLRTSLRPQKIRFALLLGCLTGLGFYVHLHWILVALMITLAVFHHLRSTGYSCGGKISLFFSFPLLLMLIPLLVAVLESHYGSYLHYLSAFNGHSPEAIEKYFYTAGSYFTALFWGVHLDYFAFKPFWGGFLNPLLGTLFFLGLFELFQNRNRPEARWILTSFPVFLLPSLFTKDVETFRMIQVLPLLLVTATLGLQSLLLHFRENRSRVIFLAGFLFFSLGLDLHHLTGPYAGFWPSHPDQWADNYKSFRFWKTYELLGPGRGPGAVLFESTFDPHDQTLLTATYPFNASCNPDVPLDSIRWVALFQEDDLQNYTYRIFPNSKLHPLDTFPEDLFFGLQWVHGVGLRVIEVNPENRVLLERWIKADHYLEEAAIEDLQLPTDQSHLAVIQSLTSHYAIFQGDPFLEMLFFERLAGYAEVDHDDVLALRFTRQAALHGILRAPTYHRLGALLVNNHEYMKAREAFLQAGRLNPLFAPPASLLQKLKRMINKKE